MCWSCKSAKAVVCISLLLTLHRFPVARTRLLQAGVPEYSIYESRGSIELVSRAREPVECTKWMERLEASGKSLNKVTDRLGYILTRVGSSM